MFAFGTETEAERGGFPKRGETPDYRYFEVAGTAHVAASIIDFVAAPDQNPIDSTAVDRAALHNLIAWIDGVEAPSSNDYIDGRGFRRRDRRPAADVCAGDLAQTNFFLFLGAHFTPFGSTRLDELYPNHGAYVTRVAKAAHRLVERREILKEDANAYIGEAAASSIGN